MKAYLAGPDVFRPDSVEHGEHLKALCDQAGLVGLYPLDNQVPEGLTGPAAATWICRANMGMLAVADIVIANLSNFRGSEPDSGTVFEVGVAISLGKPVIAYFPDQGSLRQQVQTNAQGLCPDGLFVEDFGLPRNLMLACQWTAVCHSAEDAIRLAADLANDLDDSPAPTSSFSMR